MRIQEAIERLADGADLSAELAGAVMEEMMSGQASEAQIAAYLMALRLKGETTEEISASAKGMRRAGLRLPHTQPVVEIVGTGGDCASTFNISTVSGFVISAAGVPVAKHGNRSVSSKCGAADVLEALGVRIDASMELSSRMLQEIGLCFLFAQKYHASMRHVAPVRRLLGIRTLFNVLGPLASPASAEYQLMGVYDEALIEPMAKVLATLGVERGMVVCGGDGLDEITLTTDTKAMLIDHGVFTPMTLSPAQYGLSLCKPEELVGGSPEENATIALRILDGTERGAKRDVVILNAAVALFLAKRGSIEDCVAIAREALDSGRALAQLHRMVTMSHTEDAA